MCIYREPNIRSINFSVFFCSSSFPFNFFYFQFLFNRTGTQTIDLSLWNRKVRVKSLLLDHFFFEPQFLLSFPFYHLPRCSTLINLASIDGSNKVFTVSGQRVYQVESYHCEFHGEKSKVEQNKTDRFFFR